KCLEKDPANRYHSAGAFADALGRWRVGPLWTRAWRSARRRPLASATLGILLVGLIAAAAVAVWPADPDKPLRRAQAELKAGKTGTLIGATGPGAWYRWAAAGFAANVVPTEDQTFTIHSPRICLLELMPEPTIESYRFSAEVRQRDRGGDAVGLYFGHERV